MICLGILWNSMREHLSEVLTDISSYGEIEDAFSMDLGQNYEKFVRDIYSQDEIAEWKVDKKIETMFHCSDNRKITIVILNMKNSKMVYHEYKKRNVFANLENMKTEIRKKYSQLVECYFFDNIFHVTDDEREYIADMGVVNEYIKKGIKTEPIFLEKSDIKILKKEENNGIKGKNC